jgi:hypothetical protein
MQRREFITLVGGAAAWSRVAHAENANVARLGFLGIAVRNGVPAGGFARWVA